MMCGADLTNKKRCGEPVGQPVDSEGDSGKAPGRVTLGVVTISSRPDRAYARDRQADKRSPLTPYPSTTVNTHSSSSAYSVMTTQAKFDRAVAIVQGLPKVGENMPTQDEQLEVRF